jgi:hypothetical protein
MFFNNAFIPSPIIANFAALCKKTEGIHCGNGAQRKGMALTMLMEEKKVRALNPVGQLIFDV